MDIDSYARKFFAENPDIEVLEAFVIDVNGVPRGKWIPRERALDVLTKGMAIPRSVYALDVWGRDVHAAGLAEGTGDPDGLCFPVPGTLSRDGEGYNWGVTLTVPIFSGGATQSGVRQALAQRDRASDGLEQTRRALIRNTSNAYQALVAGVSEVEARRLAVVSAQSALDASQVGLEVGTRTVLDVLQNQRTLFQAQVEYAQARYNFLQNRLVLEQAAGTLDGTDVQDINRLLTADAESRLSSQPVSQ